MIIINRLSDETTACYKNVPIMLFIHPIDSPLLYCRGIQSVDHGPESRSTKCSQWTTEDGQSVLTKRRSRVCGPRSLWKFFNVDKSLSTPALLFPRSVDLRIGLLHHLHIHLDNYFHLISSCLNMGIWYI